MMYDIVLSIMYLQSCHKTHVYTPCFIVFGTSCTHGYTTRNVEHKLSLICN